MTPESRTNKVLSALIYSLYLLFFASTIFSFRAFSSISIGLIFLAGLFYVRLSFSRLIQQKPAMIFLTGCIAFFILQLLSLLYTTNTGSGWNHVRVKSGLAVVPLAVAFTYHFLEKNKQRLLLHFSLLVLVASLYCTVMAISRYFNASDASIFFYHDLVSPLSQHAVYFSMFVFIALVFLLEGIATGVIPINKSISISVILFLSIFLFLLSSKLVIIFYLLYIILFAARFIKITTISRSVVIGVLLLFLSLAGIFLFTANPVSKRFSEIFHGNITVVKQEKFDPGDYFNGIQLRLLEWKFVSRILSENKSWLLGVTPGDAQQHLDQKYISTNMYIGDPVRKDKGFLGYNTHNQFLEALLQNGIIGAMMFLIICAALLKMIWAKKKRGFTIIILLLLAYSFVESVFETQYGIIIFTFFPLFLLPDKSNPNPDEVSEAVFHN